MVQLTIISVGATLGTGTSSFWRKHQKTKRDQFSIYFYSRTFNADNEYYVKLRQRGGLRMCYS